jgi:hypothetical protein
MSSHHFVKEGQEPALCILDNVSFATAKSFLEWAPKILVIDTALEAILTWGIKVDVVLLKPGSANRFAALLELNQPLEILHCPFGQEAIRTVLDYFLKHGQYDVNIMVFSASQYVPLIAPFTESMNIVLYENQSKWTFHTKNFRKWVPKDTSFHIFATQTEQQVASSGLFNDGRNYITESDGIVTFNSETPFWVIEEKIF